MKVLWSRCIRRARRKGITISSHFLLTLCFAWMMKHKIRIIIVAVCVYLTSFKWIRRETHRGVRCKDVRGHWCFWMMNQGFFKKPSAQTNSRVCTRALCNGVIFATLTDRRTEFLIVYVDDCMDQWRSPRLWQIDPEHFEIGKRGQSLVRSLVRSHRSPFWAYQECWHLMYRSQAVSGSQCANRNCTDGRNEMN